MATATRTLRPILMSGPMVRACFRVKSPKTVTRRIVKPQPTRYEAGGGWGLTWKDRVGGGSEWLSKYCPYGQPGDVLWVRESIQTGSDAAFMYRADCTDEAAKSFRWKPSIHMPYAACRLWLKIVSVRVERVQDISEADAIAEGAEHGNVAGLDVDIDGEVWNGAYRRGFAALWDSINGAGSFALNPWVWVVAFRRTEKPQ